MPETDHELLRSFATDRCEAAFRTLVDRHLPVVWSCAQRVTNGDRALAQDVAQQVFADLATKARTIPATMPLGGWLHRHAFFTASKAVRTEVRRRARETHAATTAAAMSDLPAYAPDSGAPSDPDAVWAQLAPHLDAELAGLSPDDRAVLVLRFFEKRSHRSVATLLGISEDAARKRIDRALNKMRHRLVKKGVSLASSAALAALLPHALVAPPARLAVSVAATAAAAGIAGGTATSIGMTLASLVAKLGGPTAVSAAATVLTVMVGGLAWWVTHSGDETSPATGANHLPRRPAQLPSLNPQPPAFLPPVQATAFLVPDSLVARQLLAPHRELDETALFQLAAQSAEQGTSQRIGSPPVPPPVADRDEKYAQGRYVDVENYRFPTEFDFGSTGKAVPTAFDSRSVGTQLSVRGSRPDLEGRHSRSKVISMSPLPDTQAFLHNGGAGVSPASQSLGVCLRLNRHTRSRLLGPWQARRPPPRVCGLLRHASLAGMLLGINFATPGSAEEVTVQVTSFQVPELTLGLETLGLAPEQDAAFYEKLARGAGSGEIDIVLDHRVSLPSGAPQVSQAVSTYRYPTEYEPGRSGFLLCPTSFKVRDLGTTVEVAATADRGDFSGLDWQERPTRIIDVNLTAGRVRPNGLRPLRIPNTLWSGLASGTQLLPSFLSEETTAAWTVFSDQPVFVSLTRPADLLQERPGGHGQQVIVTFARATATPNAALVRPEDDLYTPTTPLRLHWLTLRVPRVAASAAVWDHPTVTAEAMLNEWLALVHDGQAVLLSHAAVATRSGNRAKVAGVTESLFAKDFEASLLPFHYETRHTGATWSVEPTLGADGTMLDVTVSLDETSLPIWRSVPVRSDGASSTVELPDFLSSTIGTSLTTRLGETRIIGAVTPMADQVPKGEAGDWVDVSFIRTAPPPRRLAKPQPSANGIHCHEISQFGNGVGRAVYPGPRRRRADRTGMCSRCRTPVAEDGGTGAGWSK